MLEVALTGGIATGKSYVREQFARLGVPTIDADTLARDALHHASPLLPLVVERFGRGVLDADGVLDRKALAAVVFTDAKARRDLEGLIHPAVYAGIADWLQRLGATDTPPIAIADIPLLYETHGESGFDRVIVTVCDEATQLARTMARGLSEAEARLRMAAQLPLQDKARRADYVIDTNGSPESTNRQVVDVLAQLQSIDRG